MDWSSAESQQALRNAVRDVMREAGVIPEVPAPSALTVQQAMPASATHPVRRPTEVTAPAETTAGTSAADLMSGESLVQQSTSAIASLIELGESHSSNGYEEQSAPLDANVSHKLMAKIVNDEYVQLSDLLFENDELFTLTLASTSAGPTLAAVRSSAKSNLTIAQWASAFRVFVTVYAKRHPHLTPSLMKYHSHVEQMALDGFHWRWYDENFRRLRQLSKAPWHVVNQELYLKAVVHRVTPATMVSKRNSFRPQLSKGQCWAFERRGKCEQQNCKFRHLCTKCNGKHQTQKCRVKANRPNAS